MNDLIKKYEDCRLDAYKCPAGIPTIGWGNIYYQDGSKVKIGERITQQKADDLFEWYIKNHIKTPQGLNSNQQKAVESLIYNIGQGAFDKSTLKQAIINNDIKSIFNNWNWITAGGKPLRGLAKRRAEELLTFFS